MKTIKLLAIVLTLSLLSCSNPNQQIEKDMEMYTTVWDDIINKGELDKINNTYFDENITLISSPENVVGIANFKDYYSNFVTGFSEPNFTIKDIFGQGDKLVKHWHFTGKHTGDFFGIPPTGKAVDVEGTTLVKMKDGKIAQEQDFMDNMIFMQQLGFVSDPNNLAVVNAAYEAFGKGDIEGVVATFSPDIVWNEAEGNAYADGNPYKGADAIVEGVFGRVVNEWDGFTLKNIELHEMSENQVLATLRYNAKHKKTGKSIDAQVAHHWTLENGKIIGFQQYVDTKQLAEASK
ncbi:ester cyclase [Hanstruepera ponticola]|uniref:ester cyclase n=1 Tax=Hanstruepera ponticola TaxID=2042995 RepID=UPI0013C539C1|nr:ester cyclase [Hanstruepera ponticola]